MQSTWKGCVIFVDTEVGVGRPVILMPGRHDFDSCYVKPTLLVNLPL